MEAEKQKKNREGLGMRYPVRNYHRTLTTVCLLQVASHVQKYFIKLANAGLPVPGRTPNVAKFSRSRKVWLCDKERVSLTV